MTTAAGADASRVVESETLFTDQKKKCQRDTQDPRPGKKGLFIKTELARDSHVNDVVQL